MGAIMEHRCNGASSTSTVTIASNSLESLQATTCRQILVNSLGDGFGPRPRRVLAESPGDSRRPNAFETLDPTVVIILVVLLFALICAAFLNSIMRCVLRRARGRRQGAAGTGGAGGRADQMAVEGLDPKTLASLPVLTFKAADESLCKKESPAECTICLSDFSENEKVRLLPKCSHVFHLDCINMWLLSHVSCPVCRDGIGDNNDEHSVCLGTDDEQAPQGEGPMVVNISDQHGRSSGPTAVAVSGNATPDLRAELLPDSTERSSSDAANTVMHSQLPAGQEATGSSSRRSLRLTLSSIFAADRFLSGRWQASSSSAPAVAAPLTTPAPAATATSYISAR